MGAATGAGVAAALILLLRAYAIPEVTFRGSRLLPLVVSLVGLLLGLTTLATALRVLAALRNEERLIRRLVVKLGNQTSELTISSRVGGLTPAAGTLVPLKREALLREILNFESYTFLGLDEEENIDPRRWGIARLKRLLRGIPTSELEVLLTLRSARQEKAPAQSRVR